jgi:hypothetical protein
MDKNQETQPPEAERIKEDDRRRPIRILIKVGENGEPDTYRYVQGIRMEDIPDSAWD